MSHLLDTDILIDYFRGNPDGIIFVESVAAESYLSTITVAEIFSGVRDKELPKVMQTLSSFVILPVSREIAEKGGIFCRDYRGSHGCELADCLIAATAVVHGLKLQTHNSKHYPMIAPNEPYKAR
jgi:predicted nucleic acid-binding protein